MKCLSLVWLAKADLSNLNSGQGSGNLTELKTYDYGRKPYVSGQATRTALFETMARTYPEKFICTAERPCADVENCWGCDLRGFLATKEDIGGDRRWSPLKVTPGLGQLAQDITSDLLTRHSVIDKEEKKSKDNRIAHVQMTDNIYKFGMVIDVVNIGKVKVPKLEGKGKDQRVVDWETKVDIGEEERINRINGLLDGIYNLSGFAKQARAAASLAPEVILLTIQDTYNQRGLKALEMDEEGNINIELMQYAIDEHKFNGDQILFGLTPGLINNEQEVRNLLQENDVEVLRISQVFDKVKSLINS